MAVLVVPMLARHANMSCYQANDIHSIRHDGLHSLQPFCVDGRMYCHQLNLQDGSMGGG